MSTARTSRPIRNLSAAAVVAVLIAGLALSFLVLSPIGYRNEWWELGAAFLLLRWGAFLGLAGALLALVSGVALFLRGHWRMTVLAGCAVVMGAVAVGIPFNWQQRAQDVPSIHDITTDTVNPPAFQSIAPLRENAPNPATYAGEEVAAVQQQAYPDIRPILLDAAPDEVFAAIVSLVDDLGWELVAAVRAEGRVEAIDTTPWFHFKDDVVIRIASEQDHTRVDVRSKSRVGRGDVGTNAERIRRFRAALTDRVDTVR